MAIAKTFFESGAQDVVAAVDVYGVRTNATINTFITAINDLGLSAIKGITSGTNALSSITSALDSLKKSGLSSTEIIQRAADIVGGATGALNSVTSTVSNTVSNAMTSITEGVNSVNSIAASVSGAANQVLSGNINDLKNISSIVSSYTNDPTVLKVFDLAAEGALMTSTVNTLITSGASNAIDTVLSGVSDVKVKMYALSSNFKTAVDSNDLDAITYITSNVGSSSLTADYPNATSDILKGFTLPTTSTIEEQTANSDKLINTVALVNGSWLVTTRNGETISDLSNMQNLSTDAQTLLTANNTTRLIPQDSSSVSSAKGNLKKNLTRDKMTMDVFLSALAFLNPSKATMTIECFWHDGTSSKLPFTLYTGQEPTHLTPNDLTRIKMPPDLSEEEFRQLLENAKKITNTGVARDGDEEDQDY